MPPAAAHLGLTFASFSALGVDRGLTAAEWCTELGYRSFWVAETTVTLVAATPPKLTPVAPVKFVPVIVTDVPPTSGPAFGVTLPTASMTE